MNKKLIIILVLGASGIILLSSGVKNLVFKRSARLVDKADAESRKSLLDLADNYKAKGNYLKAKKMLLGFTERFPDAEEALRIAEDLNSLNINLLFSDVITDDSVLYEIKPGDTLTEIASRFNTTVGLLKRANNLKTDLILPGRSLKVNKAKFNILVNKTKNTLALKKSGGETIKTYTVSTGKDFSTPTGTFKIEEKLVSPVWYKVGAIVEPDSAEYELGSRWMGISLEGYGIHGTNDDSTIGKHITKGCVRMRNEDVIELFAIVPTGTEVVIVE